MNLNGAPLLEVEGLSKHFEDRRVAADRLRGRRAARLTALDGVSLTVRRNETVGIVGESGSGKTTLARCIVRLVEADGGSVAFDGADVLAADARELRRIRREVQLIYQDPYSSLNPRMSVGRAISEPALVHRLIEPDAAERHRAELLERVGLPSSAAALRPHELSGGQRQRVAIARSLALNPRMLVADEAVSALDVSIQAQILALLERLTRELGLAMIFISHQLSVIARLSQRVAIMYLGRIVEIGPTAEVFSNPRHPYTAALLRAHPTLELDKPRAPALAGEIPSPYHMPEGCRFHPRCPLVEERCRTVDPPPVDLGGGRRSWCHVLPYRSDQPP